MVDVHEEEGREGGIGEGRRGEERGGEGGREGRK